MSLIVHWRSLDYLNEPQYTPENAHGGAELLGCLKKNNIFDHFKSYLPTLVGPHALGTATEKDTVRIVCEVYANDAFRVTSKECFQQFSRFALVEKTIDDKSAIIVRFKVDGFYFEVIGQPLPVEDQPEFLLTVVEDRLVKNTDHPLATRQAIVQARAQLEENSLDELHQTYCELFQIEVSENKTAVQQLLSLIDLDEHVLKERYVFTLSAASDGAVSCVTSNASSLRPETGSVATT